jgi:hypothetical protein
MVCFTWIILIGGFFFVMITLIRWFEQTSEAVDNGWWDKLMILLAMPFAVWFFGSRISAGRPFPVPLHEPVRGFGSIGASRARPAPSKPQANSAAADQADRIAKLKRQMRQQGMLDDDSGP